MLSFLLALLLNNKLAFADTSKALVFSPAIIAPIIVGIIWVYILDPKIGVVNGVLRAIGAGDPPSSGSAGRRCLRIRSRSSISGSSLAT